MTTDRATDFEADNPETPQGRAMFEELRYIHGAIRQDLEIVKRLATEVPAGLPAAHAQAEISRLQTNGPLWQLKVNCLQYCRFVHMHHRLEDMAFFPNLRRANPALAPVIDKLESDHRVVSDLLDEIEAAAAALTDDDGDASRAQLSAGLEALARELLEHLDYEERSAGPTIRRLTRF